jgi:hypothetical protein
MKNTILKIAGVKDEKSFYDLFHDEASFLKAYPKFALGGKMNIKAMQKFAGGGFFQDAGEGIGNYFKAVADTTLGTFGATNVIKDSDYSGYGANEMSNLNETFTPITGAAVPLIAGAVGGPAAGMLVSSGQQLIGGFNPEDNTGLDENGNPKNPDAAKYQKAGQTIAQLGSFGAQAYGAFGGSGGAKSAMKTGITTNAGNSSGNFLDPSNMMGQTQFRDAKYGGMYNMGRMQYAMGGMNVQPNAEVQGGEMITSDTPPQLFNNGGIRLVSNNPYSDPTYETNGPSHDTVNEDGTTGMPVFLENAVINGLTKVPKYMANKKGETFDDHMKKHAVGENKIVKLSEQIFKKAQNGDKYSKNTSSLILPILDQKLKEFADYKNYANNVQNAIVANKEQLKAIKRGELPYPSQYNEQIPQGMPEQSQGEMAIGKHGGMMNYMAMGGIQESDYQTDPGKLPSLLRQQKANDATILGMRSSFGRNADTNNVEDPLVVTFNKAKNYGKELADKIKNHPDNKKIEPFAMGGKLPMYYMGGDNDPEPDQPYTGSNYKDFDMQETNYFPQENYVQPQSTFNPYSVESWKFQQQLNKDRALYGNSAERISNQYTPAQNWNAQGLAGKINPNAGSPSGNTQGNLGVQGPPKIEGKGFDYKKAAGNLGQFALQNAGNIYDLGRSTQDNSKLNLSRISPTFLDKTQDLQNNLRLYSEGKRQTAEASQGNASTYLSNMYANRASKLANDLNINTTYGNLNASIDNAAKLYNAGAIDKETMFKLQAEGMNRNLKGQALAGMSQNFLNQRNSDRQDALDQERLGLQKQYYKAFYDNQDRENQRRVDEITKGKSNSNLCIGGNCFDNTGSSNQTQSTQSTPFYFSQSQDKWNAMSRQQEAENEMKKLTKGKK